MFRFQTLNELPGWDRAEFRMMLSERQNHRCCWCGCRMDGSYPAPDAPTFEHVTPKEHGGADDEFNLTISCFACNRLRESMPAQAYHAWHLALTSRAASEPSAMFDDQAAAIARSLSHSHPNGFNAVDAHFARITNAWIRDVGGPVPTRSAWLAFWAELAQAEATLIPFHDPTSDARRRVRFIAEGIVLERQNHRCCFCGFRMNSGKAGSPIKIMRGHSGDWMCRPDGFALPCPTCTTVKNGMSSKHYGESVIRNSEWDARMARRRLSDLKSWTGANLTSDDWRAVRCAYEEERSSGSDTTFVDFLDAVAKAYEEEAAVRREARRRKMEAEAKKAAMSAAVIKRRSFSIVATAGSVADSMRIRIDTAHDVDKQHQAA